jgi:hypothetical protein
MENSTINFISKNIEIKNINENLLFFTLIEDYFGNICYKKLNIDDIISLLATEENKGVIDYLVNLMNEKFINESYFYINQLCIMLTYKNYKTSIKRFLYNNCLKNLKFCLKCYLLLKSLENTKKISKILFKIEEIISKQDLKKVLKEKKQFFNYKPDSELNYFEINLYFYEILKNMCIKLLDYPISNEKNNNCITRKEIFKTFIKSINDYFYDIRYINYLKINKKQKSKNKENNVFLNKGFILPFNSNKNTFEDSFLILNIIKEESNIFNTYSRVPMKLTCECIKNYNIENFYKLIDDKNFFDRVNDFDNLYLKNNQSFLSISTNLNLYEHKEYQVIDKWINLEKDLKKFKEDKNIVVGNSTSNLLDYLDFEENKEKSFIFLSYKIDEFKPFGDEDITNKYKQKSIFKNFDSYQIKSFIVKANDDLLQEMLILQIIKKFSDILKPLEIDINSYEIVMIGVRTGILEFLTNSSSINYILNKIPNNWNLSKFFFNYFKNNLENAKINFLNSLVGFCLISYFLQIKDRHNENILIDNKGRIMHIDFGFVLGASPGGFNIEKSNMKLTEEYVKILGGLDSNLFKLFKSKFLNGIIELQKHYKILKTLIDIMCKLNLRIFDFVSKEKVVENFRNKFLFDLKKVELEKFVDNLIMGSYNDYTTWFYDSFQYYTNKIKY